MYYIYILSAKDEMEKEEQRFLDEGNPGDAVFSDTEGKSDNGWHYSKAEICSVTKMWLLDLLDSPTPPPAIPKYRFSSQKKKKENGYKRKNFKG